MYSTNSIFEKPNIVYFQDMINRRISMDMMMHVAQSQKHKQFIFLTPQNMRYYYGHMFIMMLTI